MHFLSSDLEEYVKANTSDEPALLQELARETHLKVLRPRMITGHHQGRVLSMLSKLQRPKNILEIGTYTGYSALCLAEGLPKNGSLHTIDKEPELAAIQTRYFEKSDFKDHIQRYTGDALTIIPQLQTSFDLVFIDGDKKEYPAYLEVVLAKTGPGALILSDNVLWSGKVVQEPNAKDATTQILRNYNETLKTHTKLDTVILPLRDGLTLSRVKY